ncbi:hypothetical protein L198_06711 [Cryptococcus wingfieldii CBS 7118]|uniref:Phytocyanin domain-containing protein n=1 Tax=Cryptococcus wingfieldii CBS 7118 TaxID=1295528 RepID=A0A1E3IIM0_9TREE|nr:hypothetical protein L198_06711 [Cryptococcus wingfieldii CBS 7118]ODN88440.1 hypothetical protein L198_06711 [Cryptococcus wingfieldii CBS 7118]
MIATKLFLFSLLSSLAIAAPSPYPGDKSESSMASEDSASGESSDKAASSAWGYNAYGDSSPSSSSGDSSSYDQSSSDSWSYDSSKDSGSYEAGSSSSSAAYEESTSKASYDSGCGDSGCKGTTKVTEKTITSTADKSYETPKYGSGSSYTGDLDSCLNMCQKQFGGGSYGSSDSATSTSVSYESSETSASSSSQNATSTSSANGTTHTVIVAPTMGVLRFVPFAVTAAEGDQIMFKWGAGPHTATLSQGENVCNKSTTENAFDSGKLNATETFMTSVTATTPQFHYCTVGMHCAMGMFGLINPPSADDAAASSASNSSSAASNSSSASDSASEEATKTSSAPKESSTAGNGEGKDACNTIDCWVGSWSKSGAEPAKTAAAVQAACNSTPEAWAWGGNWDMSSLLSASVTKDNVVENVLYSRLMISMNPDMLTPGASMDNFIAAPNLNDFAASNPAPTSSDAAEATPDSIAGSASSKGVSATASASGSASAERAQGASTSGAGRIGTTMLTALVPLFACALFSLS